MFLSKAIAQCIDFLDLVVLIYVKFLVKQWCDFDPRNNHNQAIRDQSFPYDCQLWLRKVERLHNLRLCSYLCCIHQNLICILKKSQYYSLRVGISWSQCVLSLLQYEKHSKMYSALQNHPEQHSLESEFFLNCWCPDQQWVYFTSLSLPSSQALSNSFQ